MVVWVPGVDPEQVAGLASTRTYPLRSSFRPGYNMAVNLVGTRRGRARPRAARAVVRAVPGRPLGRRAGQAAGAQPRGHRRLRRGRRRHSATRATPLRRVLRTCAGGVADREKRAGPPGPVGAAGRRRRRRWSALRVGDVIRVPAGTAGRAGRRARPGRRPRPRGEPRPLVLTEDRWAGRLSLGRLPRRRSEALGRMRVPQALQPPRPARAPRPGRALRETGIDRARAPAAAGARRGPADEDRRAGDAAAGAARAPVPRLRGPRGARPLGRAPPAAASATPRSCASGWLHPHSLARTFDRVCGAARRARLPVGGEATSPTPGPDARGSGPSPTCWSPSACAAACGAAWARRSWPARCRSCSTRPAGRRRAARVPRGAVADASTRPWRCGTSWRPTSAAAASSGPASRTSASCGRSTAGRAARRWRRCSPAAQPRRRRCRPATSCAGPGRWSTCSARSADAGNEDTVGRAAGDAVRAIRRGVVAVGEG